MIGTQIAKQVAFIQIRTDGPGRPRGWLFTGALRDAIEALDPDEPGEWSCWWDPLARFGVLNKLIPPEQFYVPSGG